MNREDKNKKTKIKQKNYIIFYSSILIIIFLICASLYAKKINILDTNNFSSNIKQCSQNNLDKNSDNANDANILYSDSTKNLPPDKIFEKNRNSIVKILVSSRHMQGVGSGLILNDNGYILTNAHVVNFNEILPNISVLFNDDKCKNERTDAKLIGVDVPTDLAVIKVNKKRLTPVSFADSSKIKPGQSVYAMGFPLGLSDKPSITGGLVSGTDICISDDIWSTTYIQTDAAINSGNSGGALLDGNGNVTGINAIKFSETSVEGMGFAIPSNEAIDISEKIIKDGYVARPALGISIAENYDGVVILGFHERSELKNFAHKGDIIIGINGNRVSCISDLHEEIKKCKIGDVVSIKVKDRYTNDISERNVVLFDAHF